MEEEITRERLKLKTLSDNAPFGMLLIAKGGHFTYINPKFTELFGFEISDVPNGRTWLRKAYPNAKCRHTVVSTWRQDFKDARPGEQKQGVFTVTCKDETEKIVSFVTSVLVSGDYLMACEDITELRHLQSQLLHGQKMQAIGTFAGGIARDFNNILNTILGYGSLLQMDLDETNPLKSYVDPIVSAAQKAADLTKSLLVFSRRQPIALAPP